MIAILQNRGKNYKVNVPDALEFYCVEPVSAMVDRIFLFFRRKGETLEQVLARARGGHPDAQVLRPTLGDRNDAAKDFGIDREHSGQVHFDVQWEDNKKSTVLDSRRYYALVNFTLRDEDRDRLILEESPQPAAGPKPAPAAAPPADAGAVRVAESGPAAGGKNPSSATTFLTVDMARLAAMWPEVPANVRAAILTIAEATRGPKKNGT